MRAVFHQPYFLPWLGYFAKLHHADCFIVLDDVQFRRNHIKRVQIRGTRGEPEWLTLSVGSNSRVPINTVLLRDTQRCLNRLSRTLKLAYGSADAFHDTKDEILASIQRCYVSGRLLADANIEMTLALNELVGNKPMEIYKASVVSPTTSRTERVIDVANQLDISTLIVGDGGMSEVHDLDSIRSSGIAIVSLPYSSYHPTYDQKRQGKSLPFISGLSIVDAVFNIGFSATGEAIRTAVSPRLLT